MGRLTEYIACLNGYSGPLYWISKDQADEAIRKVKKLSVATKVEIIIGYYGLQQGSGAYGVMMSSGDHEKTFSQAYAYTTKNRCELSAAVTALSKLKKKCQVTIFTANDYVAKGGNDYLDKWQKQNFRSDKDGGPIMNEDLWRKILQYKSQHKVKFKWIRTTESGEKQSLCITHAKEAMANLT